MSRSRFYDQVARATGESSHTLRRLGFSVLRLEVPLAPPPLAERLCLSCPGCGHDVPLAGPGQALPELAECERCDIAYPYFDDEVFLPETEDVCV